MHLGAGCFCTALDFLLTSKTFLELSPGTAVAFSPATLVGCQGIVDVGVDQAEFKLQVVMCDV